MCKEPRPLVLTGAAVVANHLATHLNSHPIATCMLPNAIVTMLQLATEQYACFRNMKGERRAEIEIEQPSAPLAIQRRCLGYKQKPRWCSIAASLNTVTELAQINAYQCGQLCTSNHRQLASKTSKNTLAEARINIHSVTAA